MTIIDRRFPHLCIRLIIDLPFETYCWKRSSRDILQYQRVQDVIHQPYQKSKENAADGPWSRSLPCLYPFSQSSEPLLLLKISPLHSGCPFQYLRSWRQGGLKQQSKTNWRKWTSFEILQCWNQTPQKKFTSKRTNHLNLNTLMVTVQHSCRTCTKPGSTRWLNPKSSSRKSHWATTPVLQSQKGFSIYITHYGFYLVIRVITCKLHISPHFWFQTLTPQTKTQQPCQDPIHM